MAEASLRILALHAFYQIPGGEDVSHRSETQLLRERGHELRDLTVENAALAALPTLEQLRATVWNRSSAARVAEALDSFAPDVVYANNLFPGLSGSVVSACRDAGVPVVRVLRNYRFTCVAGSLFREGSYCDSCVGRSGAQGIIHGCYRGSRPTSAVATAARAVDRRASSAVRYIAVSEFVRDHAIRAGIEPSRVTVRPNLCLPTDPRADLAAGAAERQGGPVVLFVGRDTPEKGLPVLMEAFELLRQHVPDAQLWVVGASRNDGPPGVTWFGQVAHSAVAGLMARADVLAAPSTWPEPFGRVVIEALSHGTPVVAAASGGLAELAGPAVAAYDPVSPSALMEALLATPTVRDPHDQRARAEARARFDADFAPESWYDATLRILEDARNSG